MSRLDKLKEIIRELIKNELEEASVTGNVAGYETPMAFSGGRKKDKKKKKNISTNSTGYDVVKEGYRKAKDEGGVRIAQAIHNNVDAIYELVIQDGKDPKEVMRAFEKPLKNSIKVGITHKYKPHPKADGADAKIKTFQSELKKFQKIADAVVSKPSKAAIKRMKDAYRTIWNRKFGAEIALGGKLYHTIIETMNEGKYHNYRNDESMTPKQKIGSSMREVRNSLNELSKLIDMNVKLKNELNVNSQSYWKNTHKALNKIGERLVKLANKVGQLQ